MSKIYMKKLSLLIFLALILISPIKSFAQAQSLGPNIGVDEYNIQDNTNQGIGCQPVANPKFQDLLKYATCIINSAVIPLIFALAVASFVWGVVQFVLNPAEEAKREKGRQFMIWGIIALAVMVSVWGLVKILGTTFGIEYVIPQVKP